MYDQLLLFADGVAVTTNGNSTVLDVYKTPAGGVPVQIAVTAVSGTGTPTLNAKVQESTDGTTWVDVAVFPAITAVGAYTRQVQSKVKKLRLNYVVSGTTPSFTITAGIVSGISFYNAA